MTTSTVAPRDFELLLTGRWFRLDLLDDASIRAQLRRYLSLAAGTRDDMALLRADARRRLFAQARSARAAGGTQQFFCLEILDGLPLPASFTVSWQTTTFAAPAGATGTVVEGDSEEADGVATSAPESLVDALTAWADAHLSNDGLGETTGLGVGPSAMVRRVGTFTGPVLGHPELGPSPEGMRSDFWLTVPGEATLALFSFVSPEVIHRDHLVDLFTVIMCTLRWSGDTV